MIKINRGVAGTPVCKQIKEKQILGNADIKNALLTVLAPSHSN